MANLGEWQPIETAPKDGASVLAYVPLTYGNYRILVMRWDDGSYTGAPDWRTDIHSFVRFNPTHWQPLPDPPTDKPGEG